ncbi:MAG: zeta toxin family protein [Candidatus Krumholzibacteriota bacterium]|nr:zeta toxin family protein [Candidatus Krumholzibacteriota bacterium]
MIGDRVNTKPKHTKAAGRICDLVGERIKRGVTFTVAGQSGSGKSEIAHEVARLLDEKGHRVFIFQQDDYFFYPPRTNHKRRVDDIDWVGTKEVDIALLDQHLGTLKTSNVSVLEKPLVIFEEDRITTEKIDLSPFDVLIAEGTYTTLLKNADYRIFINRDYHDTFEDRKERGREKIDSFSEKIMKIEDSIISRHKSLANIIVSKDFSVELVEPGAGE